MKRKKKIFQTREEYEAWKERWEKNQQALLERIRMAEAELEAKRKSA